MARLCMALVLGLVCCTRAPAAAPPPVAVAAKPALGVHEERCGEVTARWTVDQKELDELRAESPKVVFNEAVAVKRLDFVFADGTTRAFDGSQLNFSDWQFSIFSPSCKRVALLVGHYGPIHVVEVKALAGYLAAKNVPVSLGAPVNGSAAQVLSDLVWKGDDHLTYTASCCGGAEVFDADVISGRTERIFFAPSAPHGIRQTATGYEVVP